MEMDLRLEAAALSEMAENTRGDPDFRVPTVDWDRTTHNVLTMEWIDGIALSDHAGLEAAQVDLRDLGRKVIPQLGQAVTGDAESYQYLVESIRKFPKPNAFAEMIRAAGFLRVSHQTLTGGIVALHSGWRL